MSKNDTQQLPATGYVRMAQIAGPIVPVPRMTDRTQVAPDAGADAHPLNWLRTNRRESPEDCLHTKLLQAEALSIVLYAETGEAFRTLNDAVQDRIHWLMADLLTDAREALDAMNAASRKARDA